MTGGTNSALSKTKSGQTAMPKSTFLAEPATATTKVRKTYAGAKKNKLNKSVIIPATGNTPVSATATAATTIAGTPTNTTSSNLDYVKILTTTPISGGGTTTTCSTLKPSISIASVNGATSLGTNKQITLTPTIKLRANNATYVLNNTISEQMNTKYITMTATKVCFLILK